MRRLTLLAGILLLVIATVPLTSAATTAPSRNLAGNIIVSAGNDSAGADVKGMFLFEAQTSPTGTLRFGYYQTEAMAGFWAPGRTQATIGGIRFFTASSGAPGAEFTGQECILQSAPDPARVGQCGWYHVIVTDGASLRLPDTFCGGTRQGAKPGDADYCPFVFTITGGDIRIYTTP